MKMLFLRIEKCADCPYLRSHITENPCKNKYYCAKTFKTIEEWNGNNKLDKLPDWCPLDDEENLYKEHEEG